MLGRLAERGIRVPSVRGVRRGKPGWELVTQFVEGAPTLFDLFQGTASWPRPPEQVARELGVAAARALLAGLEHRDLHPGNILIDGTGKPWLVDVAHARLRRAPSPLRLSLDLLRLTAASRENATIGFRQRFLLAFFREIPDEIRVAMCGRGLGDLARRLEEGGRLARVHVLSRQESRWMRDSSAARTIQKGELSGWVRRDLVETALVSLLARAEGVLLAASIPSGWTVLDRRPERHGTSFEEVYCSGLWPTVQLRWLTLASLEMHGIPAARPVLLLRRPLPLLIVEVPLGSRPIERTGVQAWRASNQQLERLGILLGTLHDRYFRAPVEDVWISQLPMVQPVVLPQDLLDSFAAHPEDLPLEAQAALRSLDVVTREARSALLGGYLQAFRGGRAERARLEQDLRDA